MLFMEAFSINMTRSLELALKFELMYLKITSNNGSILQCTKKPYRKVQVPCFEKSKTRFHYISSYLDICPDPDSTYRNVPRDRETVVSVLQEWDIIWIPVGLCMRENAFNCNGFSVTLCVCEWDSDCVACPPTARAPPLRRTLMNVRHMWCRSMFAKITPHTRTHRMEINSNPLGWAVAIEWHASHWLRHIHTDTPSHVSAYEHDERGEWNVGACERRQNMSDQLNASVPRWWLAVAKLFGTWHASARRQPSGWLVHVCVLIRLTLQLCETCTRLVGNFAPFAVGGVQHACDRLFLSCGLGMLTAHHQTTYPEL